MLNLKSLLVAGAGSAALTLAIGAGSAEALTFGGQLFSTGGNVQVKILGNPDVAFTSTIGLYANTASLLTPIGTNEEVDKLVNLGSFAAGQELLFGIFVQNTEQTYFMGSAFRNPDNVIHNTLEQLAPGVFKVAFEDTANGGDESYSDVVFEVSGAVDDITPVPTPALLPGLVGMGIAAWRKRHQETAEPTEVK
ncbi:PTPA-CTERM sorting domain-containing protein [Leptolyngbya ohadii]|uniref:PTPA-CTERM sorting domain-containing protein n=1 Tax=Leptolyngbya ohadii TaxID=1962290 RepID=UPI000B599E6F|nr:PTPA-CTERM sorting domain-containing protein [Leptolyngbya ohadii]